MLPFCVITPRSIRNGTGIPSSRIYFFLRLCEREIFGCLVEAFIFFLIVMVPFLLTRTLAVKLFVSTSAFLNSAVCDEASEDSLPVK